MSVGAWLGYEDQPSGRDRRPAKAPAWGLAPASIGWAAGGVVLLVLGLLARRPDLVAIGTPLLLGVAWSASTRPRRLATARLAGDDQPTGSAGIIEARVEIEPAEQPTMIALRVRAPGHRASEALVLAESSVAEPGTAGASAAEASADGAGAPADGAGAPADGASAAGTGVAESVGRRSVVVSMRTVRTGRRELFGLAHRAVAPEALVSGPAVSDPPLTITILPSARSLEELPLPFRLAGLTGPHGSRRAGSGGDLHDIAPFTPGDRLRRIDWRVTARLNTAPAVVGGVGRGAGPGGGRAGQTDSAARAGRTISRLYVRRTFATADATVMLVIDSRDQVGPRVATWGDAGSLRENESTSLDVARHAAVSMARQYLAGGDRVGLEDLGKLRRPVPPAGGRRQLQLLTQQLALAEPEGEPTHRERIPRLPSGALILVFSTFLDDDAAAMAQTWRRAGHRVLAVDTLPRLLVSGIPERLHVAYRIVAMERTDRIAQLAAAGVETLTWMDPRHDPGTELTVMSRVRGRR